MKKRIEILKSITMKKIRRNVCSNLRSIPKRIRNLPVMLNKCSKLKGSMSNLKDFKKPEQRQSLRKRWLKEVASVLQLVSKRQGNKLKSLPVDPTLVDVWVNKRLPHQSDLNQRRNHQTQNQFPLLQSWALDDLNRIELQQSLAVRREGQQHQNHNHK